MSRAVKDVLGKGMHGQSCVAAWQITPLSRPGLVDFCLHVREGRREARSNSALDPHVG
jgi:hypothetical protein